MSNYTQEITLDVDKNTEFKYIYAKQGDKGSRFVKATFIKNGEKLEVGKDEKAIFRARKPDGHSVMYEATVNEDKTITVELTEQTLAVEGVVDADIKIESPSGEVLSCANFKIEVEIAPLGNNIESSNEFLVLTKLIGDANNAISRAENTTNNILELKDSGAFNGVDGKAATIYVGKTTTVDSDTPANVTNTGTEFDAIFNFTIPKGAKGEPGQSAFKEILEYQHNGNQEIYFSNFDWSTAKGTTTEPHGLQEATRIIPVHWSQWFENPLPDNVYDYLPYEWYTNKTDIFVVPQSDTELLICDKQLNPITVNEALKQNKEIDFTKFHFEVPIAFIIDNFPNKIRKIYLEFSGVQAGGGFTFSIQYKTMSGESGSWYSRGSNNPLGISSTCYHPYWSCFQGLLVDSLYCTNFIASGVSYVPTVNGLISSYPANEFSIFSNRKTKLNEIAYITRVNSALSQNKLANHSRIKIYSMLDYEGEL